VKLQPRIFKIAVDVNLRALGLDSTSHLSQVVYGNIEDDEDGEGAEIDINGDFLSFTMSATPIAVCG
jgi:hypothetical protein